MSSVWTTFQSAGAFAYLILLCGIVSVAVGLAAIAGVLASKRAGPWISAVALALSGVGLALGGVGTYLARGKVDAALEGAAVGFAELEAIYVEGYAEARDVSLVALVVMALPLVLSALAAGVSVARSWGPGQRLTLGVVAMAAGFMLLGAASAAVGVRSGADAARARAVAQMRPELASFLQRSDCDACAPLAEALEWRGATQLEIDVPGAREGARRCVDERLAAITGAPRAYKRRCNSDDPVVAHTAPTPAPSNTADTTEPDGGDSPDAAARKQALAEAAEFGMLGLLGQRPAVMDVSRKPNRLEALKALQKSPLLLDDAQRRRVVELIAVEQARPAPKKASPARPNVPRVYVGAVSVSGRLPPEVIQRIVRQNYGRFRLCYEAGLVDNPKLEGRVEVRFVIARDGSVASASSTKTDLPDAQLVKCVVEGFRGLSFPQPEGGIVSVSYPLVFSPST